MDLKHRKPNRLKKYDYSDTGWYFVTICTKDKHKYFGNVVDNKMVLNEFGKIVKQCWLEIPNHFNNIELDECIMMPNHIHGIIVIRNTNYVVGAGFPRPANPFCPTLGQIIGYFKYQSTKHINILTKGSGNPTPTKESNKIKQIFQRSYYDHIIRNENNLNRIRQYIRDNPLNWNKDRNNIFDE